MGLFYKNVYSNLIQQKFSIPSNLISNRVYFEIKFEGIENLADESVLKSFYFFILIFNSIPSFRQFSSRYHLGKTFYRFRLFLNLEVPDSCMFLSDFFSFNLSEPHKLSFDSKIFYNNLFLRLVDLKNFYLVESNPHFFKWEKELYFYFFDQSVVSVDKKSNLYFWSIESLKIRGFNNFWSDYVS